MQEIFPQILSYALGVWRHRWVTLVSAWVIALVGWAYVWQMRNLCSHCKVIRRYQFCVTSADARSHDYRMLISE